MSGLESLFNGDGRLPKEIAEKLPFSLGYKREFECIFEEREGGLPKFPRPPGLKNGKKWAVKIPFYWVLNFNRMVEFSWNSFLNFVDMKNRELEKAEQNIIKEFGNTSASRIRLTQEQIRILSEEIKDTKNNIRERSEGYDYILKESQNLSKRIVRSENPELMNIALATFGAYISEVFNKKMLQVFDQGSTKGKLYWRDCIFRSQVMTDILGEFFKKIESNMKGYVKESETFLNPDIALVENRFDTRKLTNYILYSGIIDYSDYKIIKTEIINNVENPYKGSFGERELEFINKTFDKVKKAEILYEKALESLVHDPQIADSVLRMPSVLSMLSSKGIKKLDDSRRRYTELAETIKKRDFLASFVFDLIDYSSFLEKPNIPDEERLKKLDLENDLYNNRKLFDLTGNRSILLSEVSAALWYLDALSSSDTKEALGKESYDEIMQELILKSKDSDDSIAKELVSEYDGEEFIPSRGDDRGFSFLGEYSTLSSLCVINDFYKTFREQRKPIYENTFSNIPELKQFDFRNALCTGIVNLDAKHQDAPPARRSTDLCESELYVKGGELEERLEKKIENEGRILLGSDPGNEEENLLAKLKQELESLQNYISKGKISELKEKLPKGLYEKIEKLVNENPKIDVTLKDCEEIILVKEKGEKAVENKHTLDYHVKKYLTETYEKDISKYEKYKEGLVDGVVRHFCSAYKAYQSDFFGERPVIAYIGNFAGTGGERKRADDAFNTYMFLPTKKQSNDFILKIGTDCYLGLKTIEKKLKEKEKKNEKK